MIHGRSVREKRRHIKLITYYMNKQGTLYARHLNSPHDVMSLQCKLLDRKRGKEEKSSKDVEQIG